MLKRLLIAVVVIVLGVLGLAWMQPDSFQVQRSTTLKAPPEKAFALINDFHRWTEWSPWEGLDPAMKRTHSGPASGTGAVYQWDGNSAVGAGRMEITSAQSPGRVSIQLDFIRPFEGHNITDFTLATQGDVTTVTWIMRGPMPFVSKLMQVFISMDRMIGKDFEAGLAKLKAVAEKPAPA
jgi:hypothetical protein